MLVNNKTVKYNNNADVTVLSESTYRIMNGQRQTKPNQILYGLGR